MRGSATLRPVAATTPVPRLVHRACDRRRARSNPARATESHDPLRSPRRERCPLRCKRRANASMPAPTALHVMARARCRSARCRSSCPRCAAWPWRGRACGHGMLATCTLASWSDGRADRQQSAILGLPRSQLRSRHEKRCTPCASLPYQASGGRARGLTRDRTDRQGGVWLNIQQPARVRDLRGSRSYSHPRSRAADRRARSRSRVRAPPGARPGRCAPCRACGPRCWSHNRARGAEPTPSASRSGHEPEQGEDRDDSRHFPAVSARRQDVQTILRLRAFLGTPCALQPRSCAGHRR